MLFYFGVYVEQLTKQCSMCKDIKPVKAFYKQAGRVHGVTSQCRACRKDTSSNWRRTASGKTKTRSSYLKRTYGIDLDTLNQMILRQNNTCLICAVSFTESEPHVDHCHKTHVVRGILCERCNLAIGLLRDSPSICEAARDYLLRQENL